MHLAVLLLAGIYTLPDAGKIPAPDAPQKERLVRALRELRTGEGADRAARELALLGDVVLPAVAQRLNEADAGERLLLLAAVSRLPRARPLLDQAKGDPHLAVRAWIKGPPPREPTDLRLLAGRYLDLLAVAEQKLRDDADEDLKDLEALGRDSESLYVLLERMSDIKHANKVQAERRRVAHRFAVAGGLALRDGRLAPDLRDPVFVAYLGLLREESGAFYYAVTALVALGEKVAPVLEQILPRPNHDGRKVLRLLIAVRKDRGRGLYDRFVSFPPDVQRAMVVLAPGVLEGDALVALLERAALSQHGSVRTAALDGLLQLDAPAGKDVARKLLDPSVYGPADFGRATRLLARAGDLAPLEQFATITVPEERSEREKQLRLLRGASMTALRSSGTEELGRRLLESPRTDLRTLGIDLVRDRKTLLAYARTEKIPALARNAVLRLLKLHGDAVAREGVALLQDRGIRIPVPVLQELRDQGSIALLIELASQETEQDGRHAVLRTLGDLEETDEEHEDDLLDLYDNAPKSLRPAALGALLPLGTEAARQRYEAAGDDVLLNLNGRAEMGNAIPFDYPLRRFLKSADARRLQQLARIAEELPRLEPGFFFDLISAWDALKAGERVGEGLDASAAQQKVLLLDALARSADVASARKLFELLVAGKMRDPSLVLGTLKAAARLVPPDELQQLVPVLRAQVKGEYAVGDKLPPPWSDLRARILRGGINALAYGKVDAAVDALCDFVLDPGLHGPAFDWRHESVVWRHALNALRHFPTKTVGPAFRNALARAESDGRLAVLHPDSLLAAAEVCKDWRKWGRRLSEVRLALLDVLERLPWEGGDVTYARGVELGLLGKRAEAAAALRAGAKRKRARGDTEEDGFQTPERMERRASIYDALAQKTVPEVGGDPFLENLSAWSLCFTGSDLAAASAAGEEAVRGTAGLYHLYRNTLAAVRLKQKRPRAALVLLDPDRRLPVKRNARNGWFLLFRAQAYRALGDNRSARHDLETAISEDRRLLPYARSLPEFQTEEFAGVFKLVDDEFFDELFSAN